MTQPTRLWLGIVALGIAIGASHATCKEVDDSTAPRASAVPVDPALLAFLSRARAAHHRADLLEENRPRAAVEVLEAFLDGPLPQGGTSLAEVREVLADTYARTADLRSQIGDYATATLHVARGLELAPEASYLRGHLFEVRGLVEERLAGAKRQQAQRLLATADATLDGPDRDELSRLTEAVRSLRAELEQGGEVDELNKQLAAAERTLDEFRFAHLPGERQASHRALLGERDRAIGQALESFERSMRIQARVIESRTRPAAGPAPSSEGATDR
jgi:tetratricopeptide (TPR) repeat protein